MTPLRITELYAFIAENAAGEGVCAFQYGYALLPMVGADMDRIDSLREKAREIAAVSGRRIRLCKFSVRTELELIDP